MTYRAVILKRAQIDIDDIVEWIASRSPSGAERWIVALEQAKTLVEESPLACGLAPESVRLGHEVRERLFKTRRGRVYRLIFIIVGAEIRILRIRGAGQRPLKARDISD